MELTVTGIVLNPVILSQQVSIICVRCLQMTKFGYYTQALGKRDRRGERGIGCWFIWPGSANASGQRSNYGQVKATPTTASWGKRAVRERQEVH